ncbi:MAG: hypothetical protein H8D45_13285 [Bacteroidetes bacterium]|nr:hypothetical protein [Bacteroidota bacterium]
MKNLELTTIFNYNHYVINENFKDVSQQDSLVSSPSGGNCMNMVMGHIVVTRDALLEILGFEGVCNEKMNKIYAQGAPPVKREEAVDKDELLKMFNESQEKIIKVLPETDISSDEEKVKNITGFSFHEAYHAGQLGVLRRIAGKEGALK